MENTIKKIDHPDNLHPSWDMLADYYFQKRVFLSHAHLYNPCGQRYYELYENEKLLAGAVVYTLVLNIFTFANIPSPLKMQVIGLPASVASPPVIGDRAKFGYFISRLLQLEKGLILGLNFKEDFLPGQILSLRTLPTIFLDLPCRTVQEYEELLRHPYRRRIHRIREKWSGVTASTTGCSFFTLEHYELYLQIMKKTSTKLELLSFEFFKNLPPGFLLTTYSIAGTMLCWHIVCRDEKLLIYFFGGMNYSLRDQYASYHNNLLGIIGMACEMGYSIIEFGQTAEVAKTRLGGQKSERRMFLFHRNVLIMGLLRLSRKLINYSKNPGSHKVFKELN